MCWSTPTNRGRSQRYFAHVTTVSLSWRVQNIVVIGRVYSKVEHSEFSSNFEFDRTMLSGTGARWASGGVAVLWRYNLAFVRCVCAGTMQGGTWTADMSCTMLQRWGICKPRSEKTLGFYMSQSLNQRDGQRRARRPFVHARALGGACVPPKQDQDITNDPFVNFSVKDMISRKRVLVTLNPVIFDRCHHNWAVTTPAKYCDIQYWISILSMVKN